jgi:DNA-binding NarL/FixJ family response regulator
MDDNEQCYSFEILKQLKETLNKHLSSLLRDHVYLSESSEMPEQEQTIQIDHTARFGNLSEQERQVTSLLLQGKTCKTIACELTISENTVRYYMKNICSKFGIQSRYVGIFAVGR